MTDHQKDLIDIMRNSGSGYGKIAQTIGVSENTVKSYCRRQTSAVAREKTSICDECGKSIDETKRKNKRFCCDSCRMKWWNQHPKAKLPYTSHCACCGREIHMRRKNERKYCSHHCYIIARYQDGSGNG